MSPKKSNIVIVLPLGFYVCFFLPIMATDELKILFKNTTLNKCLHLKKKKKQESDKMLKQNCNII